MCEFHDSNCNGFGDKWWTDKCTYFSSIDLHFITFVQCSQTHTHSHILMHKYTETDSHFIAQDTSLLVLENVAST